MSDERRAEIGIKRQGRLRLRWEYEDRGYETPCWIWTGARQGAGYGTIRVNWRTEQAHRLMVRGGVPKGLQVDHLCRVRECVNPDHLELVTNAENQRRGARAKLDWGAVRTIRSSPESNAELAQRFGVSVAHVSKIRAGRQWQEVQS